MFALLMVQAGTQAAIYRPSNTQFTRVKESSCSLHELHDFHVKC